MPQDERALEIEAKTITRLSGTTDPWFLGRYGMNLYRGCAHGCLYCDGRAERYHVAGDFARDVQVKVNAVELLGRELGRAREPGYVFVGGGVSDAWQPLEARYGLARGALRVAQERGLPVHVLTKSALVERDLELLAEIGREQGAILSFSIQTLDEEVRARTEPGAAPIAERWRVLERAKALGLATGVMAMPVLPGLSDTAAQVARLVARAAAAGVDFVLCGGLTLRPGVQRDTWLEALGGLAPRLLAGYRTLYGRAPASGAPDSRYHARLDARFREALAEHRLPSRPPRRLFRGRVPLYTELAVLLEHREHALAGHAPASGAGLGRAGWALQEWARRCLAENRRRSYGPRDVEAELRLRLADGSLAAAADLSASALPLLRAWIADPEVGAGDDPADDPGEVAPRFAPGPPSPLF